MRKLLGCVCLKQKHSAGPKGTHNALMQVGTYGCRQVTEDRNDGVPLLHAQINNSQIAYDGLDPDALLFCQSPCLVESDGRPIDACYVHPLLGKEHAVTPLSVGKAKNPAARRQVLHMFPQEVVRRGAVHILVRAISLVPRVDHGLEPLRTTRMGPNGRMPASRARLVSPRLHCS